MNILIINSSTLPLPPVKGGAVEYLVDLFLKYNETKKNYNITIISKYDKNAEKESKKYKNCKFIWIKTDKKIYKIRRYIRALIRKIRGKYIDNAYVCEIKQHIKNFDKYELVISENVAEYGLAFRKKIIGKFVLHLHNDILNKDTKQAKEILKSFDECWCLSNFVKERVNEIEDTTKTKLLYNGIDIGKFELDISNKEKENIKKKLGIKANDKVVMYSGRLVKEKGVLELIEAFEKIKIKNVKLLIVGGDLKNKHRKNNYERKLDKLIKNNSNIIYTGFVKYSELPKLYNIADVGVIPSMWEEPFALTVVEFMASGKPTVVTESGAIQELVDDKYSITVKRDKHLVENMKNAILTLLDIDYDIDEIRRTSYKFSSEKYCKTFNLLIEKLILGEK